MSSRRDDDPAFAELFDELLQQLLEGVEPDLARLRQERPQLADRLDEAHAMACGVAGRRTPSAPQLGGYQIVRELGRGGMGTVYLARHETLDRQVALKVLPASFALSAKSRRRFHEETRALARLQHDHIVRIHRVVEGGDWLAFEMEYVDGRSLRQCIDHLRGKGARPALADLAEALGTDVAAFGARTLVDCFVRLGVQIGRALAAAHRAGIVHRDVKPANVLLRRDGRALLVDFGLALGLDPDLTRRGDFVGTPTYAPPEQLRGGDEAIDARADVYALGVTLYEAIALAPPIHGRSTTELLRRIEEGRLVPLRQRAPHVSRDLETILQKAMEREPKDRYATADEFADDLERMLHLEPIRARPAGIVRRTAKLARRNLRTLAAAATGALLVTVAAVPLVEHFAGAESRRALALESIGNARLDLLRTCISSDWRLFALAPGPHVRHLEDGHDPGDAFTRANDAYAVALANGVDDDCVRGERDVVHLLAWLRAGSPSRRGDVAAAMASSGFTAALAPLPPLTAGLACCLVDGTVAADLPADAATAAADDCRALGLLAFLSGEYVLAERAWTETAAAGLEDPLIDVGLGMLHLADGRANRAYLRLLRGAARLPRSPELDLLLADAALAMGDAPLAAQWFARVETEGVAPAVRPHASLLAADLANARGDVAAAHRAYERLHAASPTDPVPRYRLAQSAAAGGDLRQAGALLAALLHEWPDVARFRLDLARAALQRGDAACYLEQACYSVGALRSGRCSLGAVADLLQVLHLGGLDRLHREAMAATGRPHTPEVLALRRPVASLLPPAVGGDVDDLVEQAAAIVSDCARVRGAHGILTRATATAEIVLQHAPGLLTVCSLTDRALWGAAHLAFAGDRGNRVEILLRREAAAVLRGLGILPDLQVRRAGDVDPNLVFGCAFATANDHDGDGVADDLIGCSPGDVTVSRGKVEVVSGGTGRVLATLTDACPDRLFGFAVAAVGDVDGDRRDDWLVGAPLGQSAGTRGGGAYLFASGDGRLLRVFDGATAGFGVSVAGAGDWNGDGVPDLAVGAAPELRNRAVSGQACIYSGKDGALLHAFASDRHGLWFGALVAAVGDIDADGRDDLAVAGNFGGAPGMVRVFAAGTGRVLHTWIDDSPTTAFGEAVIGAGDLDGDGHGDVLVAAPGQTEGMAGGRVFAFSGRDGRILRTLFAGGAADRFGKSIAAGLDVDGDLVPDVAIGTDGGGNAWSGCVRVYSGATGALLREYSNPTPASSFASDLSWLRTAEGTMQLRACNHGRGGLGSLIYLSLRLSGPSAPVPDRTPGAHGRR